MNFQCAVGHCSAVRWSSPKLDAAGNPTLYTIVAFGIQHGEDCFTNFSSESESAVIRCREERGARSGAGNAGRTDRSVSPLAALPPSPPRSGRSLHHRDEECHHDEAEERRGRRCCYVYGRCPECRRHHHGRLPVAAPPHVPRATGGLRRMVVLVGDHAFSCAGGRCSSEDRVPMFGASTRREAAVAAIRNAIPAQRLHFLHARLTRWASPMARPPPSPWKWAVCTWLSRG